MIKQILLCVLMLGTFSSLQAQHEEQKKFGKTNIHQDERVDTLLERHIYYNKTHKNIDGYRIMIFFDSGNHSKDKAYETKGQFEENYPDVPAYISFSSPYYRVRVGDFRSRMEADKFLQEIKTDYPNAYVLKSEIEYPDL